MSEAPNVKIRRFIEENLMFRADGDQFSDSDSLLSAGLIDSTSVLEFVAFLEGEFGISVDDSEIVPENLDSIQAAVKYLERKGALAVQ